MSLPAGPYRVSGVQYPSEPDRGSISGLVRRGVFLRHRHDRVDGVIGQLQTGSRGELKRTNHAFHDADLIQARRTVKWISDDCKPRRQYPARHIHAKPAFGQLCDESVESR